MSKQYRIVKLLVFAGLLTAFIGCAATPKRESTGQYIDDSVITTKVKADILGEKSLKVFQISVKSTNGVVELSGAVDSSTNISKAGEVASRVAGVTEVRNALTLK